MSLKKPLFVVVAGDGINCERETATALQIAGAAASIVHVNDLLAAPEMLRSADGFAIPGGFSFGDELGSGQIMALKMKYRLGDAFYSMVRAQKPIIGICNGFQVLVKLGLLPFPDVDQRVTALAANRQGAFIDQWVRLKVEDSVCLWTSGLDRREIELPIRHGEGRIVFAAGQEEDVYRRLQRQRQIPLTYSEDVNGSFGRIAALTDPSGCVLGLMPHPEAFVSADTYRHPAKMRREGEQKQPVSGDGLSIFRQIVSVMTDKPRMTG